MTKKKKKEWIKKALFWFFIGIAGWAFFIGTYDLFYYLTKWIFDNQTPDFLEIGVEYFISFVILFLTLIVKGKGSFKKGIKSVLSR